MNHRRGITLLVVLVIVVVAALVGTGALDSGRAIAGVARTSADHDISRTLALAGVRGATEQLLEQRDALLEGEDATLPDEIELWEEEGRRAVAFLLPIGPDGETVVSEGAKLNVNHATVEMLGALPMLSESVAQRIIDDRGPAGYTSITDLLMVEGVTPELLFGDRDRWAGAWDQADRARQPEALALCDLVTVHSAEPNVQRGLNKINREMVGQKRVNLNRTWSDEMRDQLGEFFDDDVVTLIRALNERGAFADRSTLINALVTGDVGADEWRWILDLFCTTPDPYLMGRVDITRALPEVLACLPSMDDERAGQAIDVLEGLSTGQTDSETWLLTQGVISNADFAAITSWVSSRSLQWRVRLRTGYVSDDAEPTGPDDPVPLEYERVTEIVIDVAGPRPRLALLEDITDRPLLVSLINTTEPMMDEGFGLLRTDDDLGADLGDGEDSDAEPERSTSRLGSARDRRERRERERENNRNRRESEGATPDQGPGPAAEGVDRRTGRWTPGAPRGQMPNEEPAQ